MTKKKSASTSEGETASVASTTEDSFTPPGGEPLQPGTDTESAEKQIDQLAEYLDTSFPGELGRTNYQVPETPVDVAIRLLTGLHAHLPPGMGERCPEPWCNKVLGHKDAHGQIHYG